VREWSGRGAGERREELWRCVVTGEGRIRATCERGGEGSSNVRSGGGKVDFCTTNHVHVHNPEHLAKR
jgi:hypothetical protein